MRNLWRMLLLSLALVVWLPWHNALASPLPQDGNEGQQIFEEKCAGCHSIGGGRRVGPDLKGVTERRERDWLVAFIRDPNALIQSGDPDAQALLEEYQVPMPTLGLSDAEIEAVLAFIASASQSEGESGSGQPAPGSVALRLQGDPALGRMLFLGQIPFANEGLACNACHSVAGVGALGGGSMGPDLTHVYSRYGREGLASTLDTLPFPVMKEVYADRRLTAQEQAHLLAFFEQVDTTEAEQGPSPLGFVLLGAAGTLVLFGLMAIGWPKQRESLSDQLRRNA